MNAPLHMLLSTMLGILLAMPLHVLACTTIAVTKGASVDGSVLVAHSDDGEMMDARIVYVPARNFPPGSIEPIYYDTCSLGFKKEFGATDYIRYAGIERGPSYVNPDVPQSVPIGYIPQVAHTYAYFDCSYPLVNEHQVAIGECTTRAKVQPDPETGKRIFYSASLARVAMERCTNAVGAIRLMGDLIEKYGYFATGETLIVGDPNEAWVFEMCAYDANGTGGLWVAKKIPDGDVFVEANEFRIREVDPSDPNMMCSSNLFDVCQAKGWWNPKDGPLDWLVAVSPGEYNHPYYSLRRVWRVLSLVNPSLNLPAKVKSGYTEDYPFSTTPAAKLSVQDVASLYRDHYEGTPFDMRLGPGGGPWSSPTRYYSSQDSGDPDVHFKNLVGAWERPLSVYYCVEMHISQLRSWLPDPIGGVCWYSLDQPYTSFLTPFHVGVTNITPLYSRVATDKFAWGDSAFWACLLASNWADLKYKYIVEDILDRQRAVEAETFGHQPQAELALLAAYSNNPDTAIADMTRYCNRTAADSVSNWWALDAFLIAKYAAGFINTPAQRAQEVPYPDWWCRQGYYQCGPKSYNTKASLPKKWYKDPVK